MRNYADHTLRWNDQALKKPANDLAFTIDRDTDGALRNQLYVMGHFRIADDQALILDVHTGVRNISSRPSRITGAPRTIS